MPEMSKKLINKLSFLLLWLILLHHTASQSSEKTGNVKIQSWIEDVPILTSLIENKKDVIEFDSSNGKIISIFVDSKTLSKKQILLFYKDFFEERKWNKDSLNYIWSTKNKRYKKKIFKIEDFENNLLIIKIITENF